MATALQPLGDAWLTVTVLVPGAFWNVTVSVRQCRSALSDCEVQNEEK